MKRVYTLLATVNSALQKLEQLLGCVALAALFFIMIANAALRYLFSSGINWSDELNGFLFIWFGFLAATYAMSTQSHLNITALANLLPPGAQLGLRTVMNGIMVTMFLLFMPPLGKLLRTLPIANVMRFPLRYVYLILPISFALMIYHILFNILQDFYRFWSKHKEREGQS